MQSDKRTERSRSPSPAPKGPRIEERTVEETVEEMNNPPQPVPTQAEADALSSGESLQADETPEAKKAREEREARETPEERAAREKQQRDMQAANPNARYTTR